jgi:hypothetical protein
MEVINMKNNNVIEITPDENGKLFVTLYGMKYEIKIKQPAKKNK